MGETVITAMLPLLTAGGPAAVIATLVIAVVVLVLYVRSQNAIIAAKDKTLLEVIERSHQSAAALVEALVSVKLVIAEIKGSLK